MQKIIFDQEIHTFQIDFLGHVNNGVYIQWMEIGRTKLLEAAGMVTAEIFKQSFAPLLVETHITYKVPLYLGDRAHVEVWLSELRNTTGIIQFRFYNGQQVLVAEGNQRGLFVDTKSMQPRRLLPEERALFLPFWKKAIYDAKTQWDCGSRSPIVIHNPRTGFTPQPL